MMENKVKTPHIELFEFLFAMNDVENMDNDTAYSFGETSKRAIQQSLIDVHAFLLGGTLYFITEKGKALLKVFKAIDSCTFNSYEAALKLKTLYEQEYGKSEDLDMMISEKRKILNLVASM